MSVGIHHYLNQHSGAQHMVCKREWSRREEMVNGFNRGAWTSQEDKLLSDYIKAHGQRKWQDLPAQAGLNRCGKSCRLRWLNYLRPDIKRGNITEEEDFLIIRLHRLLGNRWSLIARRLPGRTDNEIKNYWNTYLRKRVSGNLSEHQAPPLRKNTEPENSNPKEKESSEVSAIHTTARRCTRFVFNNQIPDSVMSSSLDVFTPTYPPDPAFLSGFSGNSTSAAFSSDFDGLGTCVFMQKQLVQKGDADGTYMSNEKNQGVVDEELYSLLNTDGWNFLNDYW